MQKNRGILPLRKKEMEVMRKMKEFFTWLAAFVLVVCMFLPVYAEEAEEFSFELHADGKGYAVAAYNGQDASVTVPDWYNNLPVTAIGDGAFQDNAAIQEVALPSTISVIGVAAFKNCTALSSLTSYEAAAEPPVLTRVPGDADDDGSVGIMDALAILQYDVGWDVTINSVNADVDASGGVDIMDALLILQYDVGWDVELL